MTKKITHLIILVLVGLIFAIFSTNSLDEVNKSQKVVGVITNISPDQKIVRLKSNNKDYQIIFNNQLKIVDIDNKPILLEDLKKGFTISTSGIVSAKNDLRTNQLEIIKQPNIIIYSPEDNQVTGTNFNISGIARVFENTFSFRLKNSRTGKTYAESSTLTDNGEMGKYGDFNFSIDFSGNASDLKDNDSLILEIFQNSPKDGTEIDKESRILIHSSGPKEQVKLFFTNPKLSKSYNCNQVFPVQREVIKVDNMSKFLVEQLINGPNDKERSLGYDSGIRSNTKVNSFLLDKGVVKIDFSNTFNNFDSCKIDSIKSQISETLKQFSDIRQVVLSVDNNIF